MAEILKERIIKLLKHTDYEPLKLSQLAKAIGIDSEHYGQFKEAFEELRRAGHVVVGARNSISLPAMAGQIVGTFRANPRGFGFVIPRDANAHGDLFIPPSATGEAMTGDVVLAKAKRRGMRAGQMQYSGEIVEILERAENRFVGTLAKHEEGWLVQPDGMSFIEPISVDDVTAKGAKEKDKVVVEILSYPSEKYLARGVIIEVLGKAGLYDTEIMSTVRRYHLPEEFSSDCIKQARKAAAGFKPKTRGGREDVTKKVIITIDPPDAKDFDDAISLERDAKGNRVLGVHIADVSEFVTEGSALDLEARDRGNSAYLPKKTIPMLPEVLSNGICSLQPDQERFTKSVYITYDEEGKILSRRFANSVIRSRQRLTYEQANKTLKGRTKGIKPEVVRLLKDMEALSRAIEQRRVENGMLHLEMPETELVFDKSGRVVDAHPADDSYPHTMIEMFMVEVNDAVAGLLDRLDFPFLRRIHPEPNELSLKNLAKIVRAFGFSLPRTPDRMAIQRLLGAVEGTDCSLAVNIAVLRSFERAQYAPMHIGHFALASTHYCHFTSPIRRYADLLVHRALEYYLENRVDSKGDISARLDLTEIGKHITFTEQRADDAEKELTSVLILQMLSKKVGEELDCVVTGLTAFGVFVQCKKFGIEGLMRLADLGDDAWKYNAKSQCMEGARSGCTVRMGQAITVKIVSVNVPARQLNVAPAEPLTKGAGVERKGGRREKYGKQRGARGGEQRGARGGEQRREKGGGRRRGRGGKRKR
jgi:ribonuclease R